MTEYIYATDGHEGHWLTGEEIVRCRDCASYVPAWNGCTEFGDESCGEYAVVEPDGFCAWGERRSDG